MGGFVPSHVRHAAVAVAKLVYLRICLDPEAQVLVRSEARFRRCLVPSTSLEYEVYSRASGPPEDDEAMPPWSAGGQVGNNLTKGRC